MVRNVSSKRKAKHLKHTNLANFEYSVQNNSLRRLECSTSNMGFGWPHCIFDARRYLLVGLATL